MEVIEVVLMINPCSLVMISLIEKEEIEQSEMLMN